jgi:PAS domain S-box-containing protein
VLAQELGTRAAIAIRHAKTVAALHLSESTYRRLAESTPASVLVTSRDSDAQYFNDFFMNYVGLSRDELADQGWLSVIHPADLERIMPAARAAMARGADFSDECRLRRHDGVYRWNLGRRVRISTADGGPERFVHVAVDIDDRHRAEDRQHLLLEASDLAARPFDADATLSAIASIVVPRLADCAATFKQLDGAPILTAFAGANSTTESPVGTAIRALLTKEEPRSVLERVLTTGVSVFCPGSAASWERVTVGDWSRPNGDAMHTVRSLIIVAIKWNERVFGALALVNHDPYRRFTEQDLALAEELAEKAAAALENARLYDDATETAVQLFQANQAKDDFLGLVSHELRTPITMIMGNAQLLRKRGARLDEETRTTALSDIDSEADRLNRIVENLLSLARAEREPQEAEPVHIVRVVEGAVERFRNQHRQRFVTVSSAINGDLADGSEFAVQHALRNFLSNAAKYSDVHEPIDVRIERSDDEVVVSVSDRGVGVANDQLPRIFEPFYRSANTGATAGFGIGLAVAKRVIEASAGHVWAEPRPGGGMIMAFALPLVKEDDPALMGARSYAYAG